MFVIEYASARDRWQHGMAAVFPTGTYWLQRFGRCRNLDTTRRPGWISARPLTARLLANLPRSGHVPLSGFRPNLGRCPESGWISDSIACDLAVLASAQHAASKLPDIDDRLVEPETRHEMLDGELVYVSPADRPHARRHAKVIALLEAHAFSKFAIGCDQLTRTSEIDDAAPDVSVYLDAGDPVTGGRQLEQLAFEVVSTESLGHAAAKAAKLIARGVRRVFAIDIERSRALEWSAELGTWRRLGKHASIDGAFLIGAVDDVRVITGALPCN